LALIDILAFSMDKQEKVWDDAKKDSGECRELLTRCCTKR
jgi:hypothetical protein